MNTLLTLLIAAVPLKWTVETTKVQPAQFEVVHGESIALEATLQSGGKPLDLTGQTAHLYWQTNGMAEAWWVGSATVTSNRLSAVFLPEMNPGAASVTGFIGVPGEIYRAAFQLRFRHGPGAIPNEIEPPVRTLDFARVTVTNAPWATPGDVADEATARANADAALSSRISELTGGAVTESDVERIASGIADEKVAAYVPTTRKVNGQPLTSDINIEGMSANAIELKSGALKTHDNATTISASHVGAYSTAQVNNALAGKRGMTERVYYELAPQFLPITNMPGHVGYDFSTYYFTRDGDGFTLRDANGEDVGEFDSDGVFIDMRGSAAVFYNGKTYHDWYELGTPVRLDTLAISSEISEVIADKADASTVEAIGQQVSAIALHLNAEDAKVVVTNYDSAVHMPEASFQVKVEGEWLKVWDEMTRWNWFLGSFETFSNAVNQALSTKGEKEWGWFNSATGDASPDGLLQLAQPRIQICSGAAYQRYGDAAGAYWVLESNGLAANINGSTNGFFRVLDEEGNAQFEIVKGDKQTVFATAKTMRSEVMGVAHYFTEYAVTNAVSNPVAEFTTSLADINWIPETSSSCPFNVNWTNKGNNIYEIEWWPKGTQPKAFMKCGYERGGETYIKNTIPVSMEYLILNGVKYQLGTATISGHTVLTLTQE